LTITSITDIGLLADSGGRVV